MKKLTYKEAYDKIIEAYFKDEIKPMDRFFCFCGTLCDNTENWFGMALTSHHDYNGYSGKDFVKMEAALLADFTWASSGPEGCPRYEEILFEGMCAALEVLKQIHKERGEDVDGVQEFTKRKLVKDFS